MRSGRHAAVPDALEHQDGQDCGPGTLRADLLSTYLISLGMMTLITCLVPQGR